MIGSPTKSFGDDNLGRSGFALKLVRSGFDHSSGLEAGSANVDSANSSVQEANLDLLKVGVEAPAGDTGNFLTNTAGLFRKTTPGDRTAYNRFFITNGTMLHRWGILFK